MVLVSSRMRSCVTGSLPFGRLIARRYRLARPRAWRDGRRRSRIALAASTHSMPLFSCKQQEKNRRPGTTWRRWLSRKLQDDHGKCARPAPRGRPALPSITGPERTKTGGRRNPGLRHLYRTRAPQDEDGRARSESRRVAEPFTVIPSHDVKQPTPTGRPAADRARHGTLLIEDWRPLAQLRCVVNI